MNARDKDLLSNRVGTTEMRGRSRHDQSPTWGCGPLPTGWSRFLMTVAGVDPSLAWMVPQDEQRQIKRVGGAVLAGTAFQVICFSVAIQLAFGVDVPARVLCLIVTGVICIVLYHLDAKFVAADWKAQGMALARSKGLIGSCTGFERVQRPMAAILRWGCSLFIASTLATFVLLKLFQPDIQRQWLFEYQRNNTPVFKAVTERHATLMHMSEGKLNETRAAMAALAKERTVVVEATQNTADVDGQIVQLVERAGRLRKARDDARRQAGERESDAAAERFGVPEKPKHTGVRGKGSRFQNHMENARLLRESAEVMTAEIDDVETQLDRLRQFREKAQADARRSIASRLSALDAQEKEKSTQFQDQLRERDLLVNHRAEWIDREARQSPNFVPMPEGLLAQLTALWQLAASSEVVATLVIGTKVLIMLLESAGPLAKFFFTAPGIYGLYVALRVHDAVDVELAWRRPGGDVPEDDCDADPKGHEPPTARYDSRSRKPFFTGKMGVEKPQAAE